MSLPYGAARAAIRLKASQRKTGQSGLPPRASSTGILIAEHDRRPQPALHLFGDPARVFSGKRPRQFVFGFRNPSFQPISVVAPLAQKLE